MRFQYRRSMDLCHRYGRNAEKIQNLPANLLKNKDNSALEISSDYLKSGHFLKKSAQIPIWLFTITERQK